MKCRYFCRLPLDISPVYLTRGISLKDTENYRFLILREQRVKQRIMAESRKNTASQSPDIY